MPKVHSHYDNLKVARDASPDEIRAAYRALTRKHHPDRNPDNADAARVMSVINVAYGVLSDPAKRSEHDRWLQQAEAKPSPAPKPVRGKPTVHAPNARYQARAAGDAAARQAKFDKRLRRLAVHLRRHRVRYGAAVVAAACLAVAGVWSLFDADLLKAPATDAPTTRVAGYARAASAPNGQPWPARSGYIDGYSLLNQGGLSDVVVDNSASDTDMFVKLFSLDGPSPAPVRTFFVRAHGQFTLTDLTTGTYDLRYRNLTSGGLARSPAFILEEVPIAHSATYHGKTHLKLYAAGPGSMQAYVLAEADF